MKLNSPQEIVRQGESFYFGKLKDSLEDKHLGEYAIIDVEKKEYVLQKDLLAGLLLAKKKFGEKLFFIVHIGNLIRPSISNFNLINYAGSI